MMMMMMGVTKRIYYMFSDWGKKCLLLLVSITTRYLVLHWQRTATFLQFSGMFFTRVRYYFTPFRNLKIVQLCTIKDGGHNYLICARFKNSNFFLS